MGIGDIFRSFFKSKPELPPSAGWAFTIQANEDLTRRIVFVHVANEAQAEEIALKAFLGLVTDRQPVSEAMMADLGVARGGHKLETGNGWSFSLEGAADGPHPLVFVYFSDESEAEAALRRVKSGKIRSRSEVPRVVLVQDLGMRPGEIKTLGP